MHIYHSVAVVSVILALAAVSNGFCCNPDQYEARTVAIVETGTPGNQTYLKYTGSISYDFTNIRQVTATNVSTANGFQETKMLVTNKTLYFIVMTEQLCEVYKDYHLPQSCIPSYATVTGIRNIGIGKSSFLATSYAYKARMNSFDMQIFVSVTNDQCTFLEQTYADPTTMEQTDYFNTTLGIKDPSVFDIPSYCPKHATNNVDDLFRGHMLGHKGQYQRFHLFRLF